MESAVCFYAVIWLKEIQNGMEILLYRPDKTYVSDSFIVDSEQFLGTKKPEA